MDAPTSYNPTSYLPQAYRPAAAFAAGPVVSAAIDGLKPASDAQRAKAGKTAGEFEASFLSVMFGQMFQGTDAEAPFSGGEGESAFRSFMTEAMGKAVARRGGVGLSGGVAAEILKLQGLK